MSQSKDRSDADTFRDPELNPLLNPLLAANMGRWAEVYFTTPADKRERAIYGLLLELKNAREHKIAPSAADKGRAAPSPEETQHPSATQAHSHTCGRCGERNPADHRFCGACGTALVKSVKVEQNEVSGKDRRGVDTLSENFSNRNPEPAADSPLPATLGRKEPEGSFVGDTDQPITASPKFWPDVPRHESVAAKSATPEVSAESFPAYSDFRLFAVQPENTPHRRRMYVGIVLAILAATLIYLVWRRPHRLAGNSPSPIEMTRPVAEVSPSNSPGEDATHKTDADGVAESAESSAASKPVPPAMTRIPRKERVARAKKHVIEPPANPVVLASAKSANAVTAGGAQEFTLAMSYLRGSGGRSRSSSEAAAWLWKAVGKGNVEATITLSDLYLRGDGVAKNCDQGRVLLTVAVRKGNPEAAERLRSLPTSGCR